MAGVSSKVSKRIVVMIADPLSVLAPKIFYAVCATFLKAAIHERKHVSHETNGGYSVLARQENI